MATKKIAFKKNIDFVPKKKSEEKSDKNEKLEAVNSTFVLDGLNVSTLDRNYVLPEIAKKQEREMNRTTKIEDDDIKGVATSLEKLGISSFRKEPLETICWGDHYKIQLFVNTGSDITELTPTQKLRCTWCHQYPQEGALMLAVPYKFVSSFIQENVYAPECVNVVKGINVEPSKMIVTEKTKKNDPKSAPKINYFKRDLTSEDKQLYSTQLNRVVTRDYFETAKLVCSFNCMVSKGRELEEKDPRFRNVNMHIAHLYQLIFGVLPSKIVPAPPFDVLLEYGGEFTVDEYTKNFKIITLSDSNQYYVKAKMLINSSANLFVNIQEES